MKIGVTSQNKLKLEAVKRAYSFMTPLPEITGYSAESGIGEQPVNEQTFIGARNRINDVYGRAGELDRIISVENGIFREDNEWVDRAVIVIYVPHLKKSYEGVSEGVIFPDEYVEETRRIGFDKITVGKVMADAGYVTDAKDPHKSISGTSRRVYLEKTLQDLVEKMEMKGLT
ncbi:MAG: DUF84 family protein [Nanoarchaeota archaeon]|nr:DUF84 family protein [Nanoarchaeota archaeon]